MPTLVPLNGSVETKMQVEGESEELPHQIWKGRLVACRSGGQRRAPGKDEALLPLASGEVNEGRRRGLAGRTTRAVDARFGGWSAAAGLRGGRWVAAPSEGTPDRRWRTRQNPSATGVGQEREEARVGSESDRGVGRKEK